MTLRQKQSKFVRMVVELLVHAHNLGYEVVFGDAHRDGRVHGKWGEKKGYSAARSLHKLKLAIDLPLFKNNRYLRSTKAYLPLGEFWESIGGTWGGRFADGNHFSLKHGRYK